MTESLTETVVDRSGLISRHSAAKQLGIHPNTFDREVAKRKFRKFRIVGSGQMYYLRSEIESIEMIVEVKS